MIIVGLQHRVYMFLEPWNTDTRHGLDNPETREQTNKQANKQESKAFCQS